MTDSQRIALRDLAMFGVFVLAMTLPFGSQMLYHWDSVQYALAADQFDYRVQHPHPPGYYVYILLVRGMRWIVGDVNRAMVLLNIPATFIGVVFLYLAARRAATVGVARLACALMLASPIVWKYNLIALNQSFSLAIGAACLWAATRPLGVLGSAVLGGALGFAMGVRPPETVAMGPLLLWVYAAQRRDWRGFGALVGGGVLALTAWRLVSISEVGSLAEQAAFNRLYVHMFLADRSVLYGATVGEHLAMLKSAAIWFVACLGIAGWAAVACWAVARREVNTPLRVSSWVLPLAIVPGVAMNLVLHIGQPAHWFGVFPAICLLLVWMVESRNMVGLWRVVMGLAISASLLAFLLPGIVPQLGARFAKYTLAEIRQRDTSTQEAIAQFTAPAAPDVEAFGIIASGYKVDWRRMAYYVPNVTWVIVLPEFAPGMDERHIVLRSLNQRVTREDAVKRDGKTLLKLPEGKVMLHILFPTEGPKVVYAHGTTTFEAGQRVEFPFGDFLLVR